jgi:hypothetical protein
MLRLFSSMLVMILIPLALMANGDDLKYFPQDTLAPTLNLSGVRIGITYIDNNLVREFEQNSNFSLNPVISQFGWQWEKKFLATPSGTAGLNEWILLFGGMEQNLFLPSLSWLIGIRDSKGFEFAIGPNASASGFAIAIAGGITFKTQFLNFPVNLAIVISKFGQRASFLTGFNSRN